MSVPKKAAGLGSNEINTVFMRPIVDFELLVIGSAAQDDDLTDHHAKE